MLIAFITLLVFPVETAGQKESILIGGTELSLGMEKSLVLLKIEDNNFIEYQKDAKAYNIWDSKNKSLMIGVIQFDENDKLSNVTKFWQTFSDSNCQDALKTLFTLLIRYENEAETTVSTQEIFEPRFKAKMIDFYVGNRNITVGMKENGAIYINESLTNR